MSLPIREALRRLVIPATAQLRLMYGPAEVVARDPLLAAKAFYATMRSSISQGFAKAILDYEMAIRREAIDDSVPGAQALLDELELRKTSLSAVLTRSSSSAGTRITVPDWACLVCTSNRNGHNYEDNLLIHQPGGRQGYMVNGSTGNNFPDYQEEIRPATEAETEAFLRDIELDMTYIARDQRLREAMRTMNP